MESFNGFMCVSLMTVVTRERQISCSIRTAWRGTGNLAEGSKGEWKTNAFRPPCGGWFSKSCTEGACYTFASFWTSEDISSSLVYLVRHCLLLHEFKGCLYHIGCSVTVLTELPHLCWVMVLGNEMSTFSLFWFRHNIDWLWIAVQSYKLKKLCMRLRTLKSLWLSNSETEHAAPHLNHWSP